LERARILSGLEHLEREHYKSVPVRVVEKGRKERHVPMPIRLVRALLVEWVWSQRRDFIAERRSKHPSYAPPEQLWLSRRAGQAMTEGAIANEIKRAFNKLEIDASAHRLRAFFLTELVRELAYRAKAIHGVMFDSQSVLLEAAEIAGHADVASLEPYLDRVRLEDNHVAGEPVSVHLPEDAATLRALADRLFAEGDDAPAIRKMLSMLLERFGLEPVPLRPILSDPQEAFLRPDNVREQ
jgi:integrase